MISCVLIKKMNATRYVYFVYERTYGQFYVDVTGKMSEKLQGVLKKKEYKIKVSAQ